MPITMAGRGQALSIKKINGRDETRRFLENLGFVAGEHVQIVSELGGNMILCVKGTRVAIDKAMANRIIV